MTKDDLLRQRFKVVADYPLSNFDIGDIISEHLNYSSGMIGKINDEGNFIWIHKPENYPAIFRKMEWWEERTLEELKSVHFVKVIKYVGYWREGDIVPVLNFVNEANERYPKPYGYNLKYKHYHPIFNVLPATKEEYDAYMKTT